MRESGSSAAVASRDFRLNGVGVRKAPKSVVRGVTIRRIGAGGVEGEPVSAGIAVVDSPASKIVGNDVVNDVKAFQADGADILNSRGSLVRGNKLSHNSWNGLVLIESRRSRIAGNELDGNGNNGTEVNGGSDSVSVTLNAANGNTAVGIVLGAARNARVVRNIARGNDTGLFFFDLHDSVIEKNTRERQSHGHRAHRRSIRLARQSTHGQHRERESGYRDRGRRGQAGYLERQLAEEQHCQQEQGPRHRSDCRFDRRRRQSRKRQRDSAAVRERRLLGLRTVAWSGSASGPAHSSRLRSGHFSSAFPVRGDGRACGAAARAGSRRAQGQFLRTSGSERPADRQVAPALADAQSVAHALEVASFCVYAAP